MKHLKEGIKKDIQEVKNKIEAKHLKNHGERRHAPRHHGVVTEHLTFFEIICGWFK